MFEWNALTSELFFHFPDDNNSVCVERTTITINVGHHHVPKGETTLPLPLYYNKDSPHPRRNRVSLFSIVSNLMNSHYSPGRRNSDISGRSRPDLRQLCLGILSWKLWKYIEFTNLYRQAIFKYLFGAINVAEHVFSVRVKKRFTKRIPHN